MIDKQMAKRKDVTKEQIIEVAGMMVRTKGTNGFSTRQLADEVGISSASLHHHFTTKDDLIAAVAATCRDRVNRSQGTIAAEIEGFVLHLSHSSEALGDDALLIAMLAADFPTLPTKSQDEARQLLANLRGWLSRFAAQARTDGELHEDTVPDQVAGNVLAEILGTALLQRVALPGSLPVPPMTWGWQRTD